METITIKNIIEKIIEKFPEYNASSKYFDEENKNLPYIVLGNLTLMAFDNLDQKTEISMAEELVKLTDDILNNPKSDDELINLFQVEVFEALVGCKTGAQLAKRLLHGRSLEMLEQTLKHFSSSQFLGEYRGK